MIMLLTPGQYHNCHFNLVLLEMLSGHTHNTHTPTHHNATITPVILEGFFVLIWFWVCGGVGVVVVVVDLL